ncbi:MAG TPA: heparan-alpha-glucosaminide N-acetyltransferase domain-containing protein, partial [Polyangia bacterium]
MKRIRAIDWLRGLVMALMTIDHAGAGWDAHHMHGDAARGWVPGSPLPPGEFLTRWITHLCAPAFVLLAGASLALSSEKRRGQAGQTAFIVKRGLLIAALDPTWMTLAISGFDIVIFQVLYAIGLSLVCMAFLRRLSSRALLAGAVAIQLLGELSARARFSAQPLSTIWCYLFVGGRPFG